jgi:cytochrome b
MGSNPNCPESPARADPAPPDDAARQARIRIWDLPTRLFHWSLAALVAAAWVSVKIGGLWLDWHMRFGLAILALLIFRLVWGLAGGRYARFGQFLPTPRAVWRQIRSASNAPRNPGHTPLAGLSVLALLAASLFQAITGLFANDDIASEGPLVKWVSRATSDRITSLHHANEWLLAALIGLHLAAILYYRLRKGENLVGPMLTGDKILPASTPASRDDRMLRLFALLVLVLVGAAIAWLAAGSPGEADTPTF